jgi:predicted transcriptional regulator
MYAIPSAATVAATLRPLRYNHLEALSLQSGVPFSTLLKIRSGETPNPRIDTVGQFWPHLVRMLDSTVV